MGTYHVDTPTFRAALKAVRPHADRTKTGGDGTQALARLRLFFDPGAGHVRMMATNTVTTGVAVVPLIRPDGGQMDLLDAAASSDDGRVAPAVADISPGRAGKLLGFFPARTSDDGLQLLRIDVDADSARFTDVGGLMAGDEIVVSRPPDGEGFPDVWDLVARAALDSQKTPSPKPLTVLGEHLGKFTPASMAYERPLTVVPTGSADSRGFVVRCSRDFIGLVSSMHNDDDSLARREADWQVWIDRFSGKRRVDA